MRYSRSTDRGATLVELLVVLVIVSILAVVAIPVAETTLQREREAQLRQTLREVRTALDTYHADFIAGTINSGSASTHGWPRTLQVLVDGVSGDAIATKRYLRRLPKNPFVTGTDEMEDHWLLRGYTDTTTGDAWNGEDVYDLRPRTDKTALDGSEIAEW